jgi:LAS superfamily LD-carboxypeptidase LdcB
MSDNNYDERYNQFRISRKKVGFFWTMLSLKSDFGIMLDNELENRTIKNKKMLIQVHVPTIFYKLFLNTEKKVNQWALQLICNQHNIEEVVESQVLDLINDK